MNGNEIYEMRTLVISPRRRLAPLKIREDALGKLGERERNMLHEFKKKKSIKKWISRDSLFCWETPRKSIDFR
jgi:hypothetical protein